MLVVANGHNEEAKWPDPPYPGRVRRPSSSTRSTTREADDVPRPATCWSSGWGTARWTSPPTSRSSPTAPTCRCATARWVIPKRLLGQPADQIIKPWVAVHVPWRIRQPLSQFLLRITVGPPERYGLPEPERGLFQDHPTITDTVLSRISHGEIDAEARHRRARARLGDASPTAARSPSTRSCGARATGCRCPFLDDALSAPTRASCRSTSASSTSTPGPVLRRADAVDRLGVPDRRAPGADRRRAPRGRVGAAAGGRDARATASASGATRSRAGASTAGRRCASTSTASCTSSGASSSAGARRARRVSRRALVTGASGAFGTALRAELRARGWTVAGLDLRADDGDDVIACDVTDDEAVPRAVATAVERLGGLDVLVNNAGHRRARPARASRRASTCGGCSTSTCSAPGA